MNNPQRLGEALSAALATGPSRATLAIQREATIEAMRRSIEPRRTWAFPALALAGTVVAVAAVLWVRAGPSELHASFHGQTLAEKTRLVASSPDGEPLDFSDGSRIVLNHRSEISVSRLSRERAQIELNRGSLAARIKKGTGRAWAIDAGPYSVRVVGTEFSVDWDREQSEIEVRVTEGRVLVVGGDLPAAGVAVSAGGRLVRHSQQVKPAVEQQSGPTAVPTEAPEPAAEAAPRPSLSLAEPSWRSAAQSAQYALALQSAERAGYEDLIKSLPEKDLLLLANTARYAGSAARARQALLSLRSRFARSPSAPVAALMLAGLAEDHAKNPDEAATWLRLFLKESPEGELSAGARARLLGILVRQGRQSEARSVASDYLRYHPQGPYVGKARAVLGSAPSP
jgi:FecR protein/Tetratricopeptide repeat-like domain